MTSDTPGGGSEWGAPTEPQVATGFDGGEGFLPTSPSTGESYWGDDPLHGWSQEQKDSLFSYETFGTWREWMAMPAPERAARYLDLALAVETGLADRRSIRLLAWGMNEDNEVLNLIRRAPRNTGPMGIGAAVDWLIPSDLNSITSDDAKAIDQAWKDHPDILETARQVLTDAKMLTLGETNEYFDEQYRRMWTGDETAVDLYDEMPPPFQVADRALDTTRMFEGMLSTAEWLMLFGMVGKAGSIARGAVSGVKGLASGAGREVFSGGVMGMGGRAANFAAGRAMGSHAGAASLNLLSKWAEYKGAHPLVQRMFSSGRTIAVRSALLGAGVVGANIYSEVTAADVKTLDRNLSRLRQTVSAQAEASGSIVLHRGIETAIDIANQQIEMMRQIVDQPTSSAIDAYTGAGGGISTPGQPGISASPATTGTQSVGASPGTVDPEDPSQPPSTSGGVVTGTGLTGPDAFSSIEDDQLSPNAPPGYIGGMPDEYVRNEDGTVREVRPSDAYTVQMTAGAPASPRYRVGDTYKLLAGMTPAQRLLLNSQLIAAGYMELGAGGRMTSLLDAEAAGFFEDVLANANWNGITWQSQIAHEIDQVQLLAAEQATSNWMRFGKFHYLPPDYDTLAQAAKTSFRDSLGREPTQAENRLFGDAYSRLDRQAQEQDWRVERSKARRKNYQALEDAGITPTRRRVVEVPREDPTTTGIMPGDQRRFQSFAETPVTRKPGVFRPGRDVDVQASMAEWFEEKYGDELDLRSRMSQSAQNLSTMLSGSQALTDRVRQG